MLVPVTNFLRFPETILNVAALCGHAPLREASLIYTGLRGCSVALASRYPKLFGLMQKISGAFIAMDFAATFWSVGKLALTLDSKFSFLGLPDTNIGTRACVSLAVAAVWITLSIYAVKKINHYFSDGKDANEDLEKNIGNKPSDIGLNAAYEHPFHQDLEKWVAVTGIVVNVALTFLAPWGILYGITAAIQTYKLIQISQWKWLKFEAALDSTYSMFSKITFQFYYILFPATKRQDENCAICQDDDKANPPDVHFCSEHVFHTECILGHLYGKSSEIANYHYVLRTPYVDLQNGRRWAEYDVSILEKDQPVCPSCNGKPVYNELSGHVQDREYGGSTAHIHLVKQEKMRELLASAAT